MILRHFTACSCYRITVFTVLALSEYRPIFNKVITAGVILVRFIETANYAFGENNVQVLFESLFELSSYQSTHFIDQEILVIKRNFVEKHLIGRVNSMTFHRI